MSHPESSDEDEISESVALVGSSQGSQQSPHRRGSIQDGSTSLWDYGCCLPCVCVVICCTKLWGCLKLILINLQKIFCCWRTEKPDFSKGLLYVKKSSICIRCFYKSCYWLRSKIMYCIFWDQGPVVGEDAEPTQCLFGLPVVGLINNDNRCFYLAMLQCIYQTTGFHQLIAITTNGTGNYYSEKSRRYDVKLNDGSKVTHFAIGGYGPVTMKFCDVLYEMQTTRFSPIDASPLLDELRLKNDAFVKGQQADCHEIARCLFQRLRAEELQQVTKKFVEENKELNLTEKQIRTPPTRGDAV